VSAKITAIGNVVNSPERKRTQNGSVTNFRMAATERRFDSATQDWVDGHTFFVDVECWGEMGGNVSSSVSKGDPVVVIGVIRTHEWDSDQGRRSRPQIKAEAVALNLARGTAEFKRTRVTRTSEPGIESAGETTTAPAESAGEQDDLDSPTGEDYGAGSHALYELDSENSSLEPARV
jgi:single-strand DNA-binding protein